MHLLDLYHAEVSTSKPKALKLTAGKRIKIEQALVDANNENSCNMSYFETGNKNSFED
jgi:hypothetical protein